jgi:hypothetical protein
MLHAAQKRCVQLLPVVCVSSFCSAGLAITRGMRATSPGPIRALSPGLHGVEEDHLKKRWTPSLTNGTWELSDLPAGHQVGK